MNNSSHAHEPLIISRDQHTISRKDICEYTLKVLYRLHNGGYSAYLVGGGVRDILLGFHPKDFDVATDARPEQIRKVIPRSRIIGKRFLLVHAFFGDEIVEVATFRKAKKTNSHKNVQGMILQDNEFGTLEEDVYRRDFTINALYYNIADFSIVDYVGGLEDLKSKTLRIIGDPILRYREDPVRILRAMRFSAKLGFEIEPITRAPIAEMAVLLRNIPPARLYEECIKMFLTGHALASLNTLIEFDLLKYLLPTTADYLMEEEEVGKDEPRVFKPLKREELEKNHTYLFLKAACQLADEKYENGSGLSMSFLLAALLWDPFLDGVSYYKEKNKRGSSHLSADEVIFWQAKTTMIPRFVSATIKDLWLSQAQMTRITRANVSSITDSSMMYESYKFLMLRAKSGENVHESANWWKNYIDSNGSNKKAMFEALPTESSVHPKKKKSKKKSKDLDTRDEGLF